MCVCRLYFPPAVTLGWSVDPPAPAPRSETHWPSMRLSTSTLNSLDHRHVKRACYTLFSLLPSSPGQQQQDSAQQLGICDVTHMSAQMMQQRMMMAGPRVPDIDICDTGNELTLVCDLPGCKKEDVHVTLDGQLIKIQAKGARSG